MNKAGIKMSTATTKLITTPIASIVPKSLIIGTGDVYKLKKPSAVAIIATDTAGTIFFTVVFNAFLFMLLPPNFRGNGFGTG